jgi:hypothetical protein
MVAAEVRRRMLAAKERKERREKRSETEQTIGADSFPLE